MKSYLDSSYSKMMKSGQSGLIFFCQLIDADRAVLGRHDPGAREGERRAEGGADQVRGLVPDARPESGWFVFRSHGGCLTKYVGWRQVMHKVTLNGMFELQRS